jgi:hypothetical protein
MREGGVLGSVAGGVQGANAQRPELELPAVVEGLVRVTGIGVAVNVDRGAGGGGQSPATRDMVGVVVRLEHVLDRGVTFKVGIDPGVWVPGHIARTLNRRILHESVERLKTEVEKL